MLSRQQARAFYDRFGARQDRQSAYEDPAIAQLIAHGGFEHARSVIELGCGTGRLAAILLERHLPASAVYRGYDLSSTMVELARRRLAAFQDRAEISLTEGGLGLDLPDGCCDRFLATYVADLLPDSEIFALVAEARRLLAADGRLCLAGLTPGTTLFSRAVTAGWGLLHRLRPVWVGGCRPLEMMPFLDSRSWEVCHHRKVTAWGLTSEVVVARKSSLPG